MDAEKSIAFIEAIAKFLAANLTNNGTMLSLEDHQKLNAVVMGVVKRLDEIGKVTR